MKNLQYYILLYDLALASSGETSPQPLLIKTIQRLMYHTGFPCGLFVRPQHASSTEDPAPPTSKIPCMIELSVCHDQALPSQHDVAELPAILLAPQIGLIENEPDYDFAASYGHILRIPVPGDGSFILLGRDAPNELMPYQQLLTPIMNNFSKNLHLARVNQRNTEQLTAEVDQHRQTLAALAESERQLKEAQRIAKTGHWTLDLTTDELEWSAEIYRIFGRSPETFTPTTDEFYSIAYPDDVAAIKAAIEIARDTRRYEIEHRIILPDGEVRTVMERGEIVENPGNQHLVLHGTVQDITAQKIDQAEKLRLTRQLEQSQKMQSIGQLTGGVAHEFNNILAVILGYTKLLGNALDGEQNNHLRQYVQSISESGERAKEIILSMLAFSRGNAPESGAIQPAATLTDSIELLRATIPSNIELSLNIENKDAYIHIDKVQLHQALMNLIINARDAAGQYGLIEVGMREQQISSDCDSCHSHFDGHKLEIYVQDNGPGIEPDNLSKIFDPFFSTKKVGEGTGMGLSIVHGIVHSANGHISIQTQPGEGTRFSLFFPLSASVPEPAPVSQMTSRQLTPASPDSCIMVVDDDPSVARLIAAVLESEGYRVKKHLDPTQALADFNGAPNDINLVISDQTMPRLLGMDLLARIHQQRPELPAILCTGYSEHVNEEKALKAGIQAYLPKPIDLDQLLELIAKYLGQTTED